MRVCVGINAAQRPFEKPISFPHVLSENLVQNLIRTNDLGPPSSSQIFASWVSLWPETQVHIFMMAVKWAAVVNLLMTSPFLCHQ